MYRQNKMKRSTMKSVKLTEGETIEQKIERLVQDKEPIKDGAPEIFTERRQGVLSAYNIRTDRFEIACDAMDKIEGSIVAKRQEKNAVKERLAEDAKKEDVAKKAIEKGDLGKGLGGAEGKPSDGGNTK